MKQSDMDKLVGMSVSDAEKFLEELGYTMRVTVEDGTHYAVDLRYVENRVNVEIKDGKIVSVRFVG